MSFARCARPWDLRCEDILDFMVGAEWFADGAKPADGYARKAGSNRVKAILLFLEVALGKASEWADPSIGNISLITREDLEGFFTNMAREDPKTWTDSPWDAAKAAGAKKSARDPPKDSVLTKVKALIVGKDICMHYNLQGGCQRPLDQNTNKCAFKGRNRTFYLDHLCASCGQKHPYFSTH